MSRKSFGRRVISSATTSRCFEALISRHPTNQKWTLQKGEQN
jgi:hypothetical protein